MWRHQTPGKIGAGSKLGDLPPGDRQVKNRDDFPDFPRFYVWNRSEKHEWEPIERNPLLGAEQRYNRPDEG
ncbi:hypothetical protein VTN49DRAFT_6006 [Thermomyces lanuginosus]|uniref:uncharacterized protein n=1 Tax=Thermomyces lanuginosus TaxID=5541 RepID=UPI003743F4A8